MLLAWRLRLPSGLFLRRIGMRFLRILVGLFAMALACLSSAQSWKVAWSSFYAPQGNSEEIAKAVTTAKDGGTYCLTYIGGWQLVKLDPTGNVVWSSILGFDNLPVDPSNRRMDVVEGKNGVYVAATVEKVYPSGPGVAFAKYDFNGQRQWLRYYALGAGSSFNQIVLDPVDDAYLDCASAGFNAPPHVLIAFDPAGNQLWSVTIPYPVNLSYIQSPLRADSGGNVYEGGLDDNGCPYVMKISPGGVVIWNYLDTTYRGSETNFFSVGSDGSVYVPSEYNSTSDYGTTLKKLSPNGTVLWTCKISGQFLGETVLDPMGPIYVISKHFGPAPLQIAKVSPSGALLWAKEYNAYYVNRGYLDDAGNLNLIEGTLDKNGDFTAVYCEKIDSNGNALWTSTSGLVGDFYSAACGFGNNVFVWSSGDAAQQFAAVSRLDTSGLPVWTNYNITNGPSSAVKMLASTSPAGITYFAGKSIDVPIGPSWMGAIDANGNHIFFKQTGASEPVCITALPSGGEVIGFTDGIRRFDSAGNQMWMTPISPGVMTLDASGNIYGINAASAFKLDPSGAVVWQASFPSNVPHPDAIAVDSTGSVVVGFDGGNFEVGVCKLSSAGNFLWRTIFKKTYFTDYVVKIACDSSNNILLTYDYYTAGTTYGAVRQFLPNGLLGWQTDIGQNLNAPCSDSVLSPAGIIVAVGQTFTGSVTRTIIFGVDASNGNILWVQSPNPGLESGAAKVCLDSKNNAIVAGWRYDPGTGYDYLLMRVSPVGTMDATATYDSSYNLRDFADAVGVDSSGNAYVAGRAIGPTGNYNFNVVKFLPPLLDDASITQTVRTTMATGDTFPVTISVKNIGINSWTAAAGYKLACMESSTWSATALPLGTNESIAPGDTKQFFTYVKAPPTAGTYPLHWRMIRNGSLFGDPSAIVSVNVLLQTNFASLVAENVATNMVSGQTYQVSLQYKNTGTNTWTTSGQYALQSANPYDNLRWGPARIPMTTSSVAPGAIGTFAKTLIAPDVPGSYIFQWQPIQDTSGLNFSTVSPAISVTVAKAADAARYLSRTGATTIYAGADFYVQNKMYNVGSNTWTSGAGYSMTSLNPTSNTTFAISKLYMPGGSSISPNFTATFTGLCTAPLLPGTYTMQWQMNHLGVLFGDMSPLLTINVLQGPDDAQFISSTPIPSSMGPSMAFGVTFTMKNLGTATWDSTYSLVSTGSNNFGVTSIVSSSVAQNANGTFTATFTAPSTPGTYTFQMRMAHNGVKFGQPMPLQSILVAADAALYVSRSAPTTVYAGQDFWVQLTMKNVGSNTWSGANGYSMMSLYPANNTTWAANRAYLPAGTSIVTGQQGVFGAICTAPISPKTYSMQWQMDKGGTPFGQSTPLFNIDVVLGPDNAQYVSQANIATKITHGALFDATITMQNIGTALWDSSYTLVPLGQSFGVSSIPAKTTIQNGNCAFSARFTAPATPGTYIFQMRMAHNGTKFGQPTPKFTVIVT